MTTAAATEAVHVVGAGALRAVVERAVARLADPVQASCLIPHVPDRAPLAEWTDTRLAAEVGGALDAVLADVQRELGHAERFVFVLPAVPLMGCPDSMGASAVTNGVLSMARTLSIELARDGVTVNVLALDGGADPAAQLAALLGPGGAQTTGQEIYLTGGSDLGRLRP
jgi:NAD(P)-dependent dehydrogenase (short-subunit alcohol dehydrogenase family)